MKAIDEFCGQRNGYPLSKTLRFELLPEGKTMANINATNLLKADEIKAHNYQDAKKILDNYNKYFIDDILKKSKISGWEDLADTIKAYHNPTNDKAQAKKALEKQQAVIRSAIRAAFEADKRFKVVTAATPNELFKNILPEFLGNENQAINTFKKFSSYFTGFQDNRKNVYSAEAVPTAIPYRIVNDNFPKFLQDIDVFHFLKKNCPEIITETEQELTDILNGLSLDKIFKIDSYNQFLSQSGIDLFNQIIGGVAGKEGDIKIKGINEHINHYWQQHHDFAEKNRKVKMAVLFKQILSDRTTLSFIPAMFESDKEVKDTVASFWETRITSYHYEDKKTDVLNKLSDILTSITSFDFDKLYINAKEINFVSQILFGNWNELTGRMEAFAHATIKTKKECESWLNRSEYSFSELNRVISFVYSGERNDITSFDITRIRIEDFLTERRRKSFDEIKDAYTETNEITYPSITQLVETIKSSFKNVQPILASDDSEKLRENQQSVNKIKVFLDTIQDFIHRIKPLVVSADADRDILFYSEFDELYNVTAEVIPLYNKVRNYLTKKTLNTGKYKLNFDAPTLADGWDQNKENSNCCVLMMKDAMYYLGIMNAHNKPDFSKIPEQKNEPCYQKMVYKLLPGPNKMLPKVFFSEKGKTTYNPPEYILKGYNEGKHIKGDSFDITFCRQLIDYFKKAINQHPDWSKFGFKFSDTKSYNDISDFYKEISEQGYKLSFTPVPESFINNLVNEGKLYLFRIYNKDFAPGSVGTPNMHTLYWKNIFSEQNLNDVVIKLNGQAELFYRTAGIDKPIIHKTGEKMVNRTTISGEPIPEPIHDELFKYANDKLNLPLSDQAQTLLNEQQITIKSVTHDIIKDRHYTEDKFLFHVPVTINFKADAANSYMNTRVISFLKNNPDINIIGLDRGERNLIYLSLIDRSGKILIQKSFNKVTQDRNVKLVSVDYHEKLDQREKERDAARKSWKTIGKIAELKEGYLSAVIHEITQIMIEHNAIIVMEDLNFGFKRGRFHVEKQVYQKFEKMLIDKLNYLVFKDRGYGAPGSILNGYQLTEQFVSFKSMGKQSGFLFYVPAGYTSKIDPVTGFVNMFELTNLTNVQKKRNFFSQFDRISYDSTSDSFSFSFDYRKFGGKAAEELAQTKWTVYSNGIRIQYYPATKKSENIDVTAELKQLFDAYQIHWQSDNDILDQLLEHGADAADLKDHATIKLYDKLYQLFKLSIQMRNSNAATDEDYILSPVKASDGTFFDSRSQQCEDSPLPKDADANGAYHIALKGLLLLNRIDHTNDAELRKIKLNISNAEWFAARQK